MIHFILQVVTQKVEYSGLTQELRCGKMSELSKDTDLQCRQASNTSILFLFFVSKII